MEAIAIYTLVLAAIGLMLAGAYGAMPVFIRSHESRHLTNNGTGMVLGTRLPVIEPNHVGRLSSRPPTEVLRPQPAAGLPCIDSNSASENRGETEAILTDLFNEVDLLRGEIEGLRGELCALIEVANSRSTQPTRRPRVKSDRQEASQARDERGLARA